MTKKHTGYNKASFRELILLGIQNQDIVRKQLQRH